MNLIILIICGLVGGVIGFLIYQGIREIIRKYWKKGKTYYSIKSGEWTDASNWAVQDGTYPGRKDTAWITKTITFDKNVAIGQTIEVEEEE